MGTDFKGILGCDYYAAYRKYARQCSVRVQFCLAHLIREVKYLCEFPDALVQRYGGQKTHRLINNMVRRFMQHGEAYFQFITTPAMDPTNNVSEQAMRFIVIDRHVTQGTRSWRGREICERLWTVMASCSVQKRSPFQWICQTITAWFNGRKVPSLLADSS